MALTWTDVNGKTNDKIIPLLVDEVYKASPTFTRIRTRNAERFEGGNTLKQPIMYAKLRGGSNARGATFDIAWTNTGLRMATCVCKSLLIKLNPEIGNRLQAAYA
jgi:hypothetical protein